MLDINGLTQNFNVIGVLVIIGIIIFAESGLLIGLLLPGDTLLFTAGFFAAQGELPLIWVIAVIFIAAILGDNLGYFVGAKAGPRVFHKKDSVFFSQEYVERAKGFYNKHGGKTVVFARFIPYVRTFAPMVAGAANMRRAKFIIYNIIGALLWTVSFVLVGYWLGIELALELEQYLVPAFIIGLVFAFSPTIFYVLKNGRLRRFLGRRLRSLWATVAAPFKSGK